MTALLPLLLLSLPPVLLFSLKNSRQSCAMIPGPVNSRSIATKRKSCNLTEPAGYLSISVYLSLYILSQPRDNIYTLIFKIEIY